MEHFFGPNKDRLLTVDVFQEFHSRLRMDVLKLEVCGEGVEEEERERRKVGEERRKEKIGGGGGGVGGRKDRRERKARVEK